MDSVIPREELADELARHLEFLRRMARALVRDEQLAEDVVQETLVAALVRRPEPEVGLKLWLGAVLRRRVLLHFRTEQRRLAREALLERDLRAGSAGGAVDEAARALMSFERSAALGREVAALDEPYRSVVLLRFYEGLQPKEIARRLQRPVATVNTQLQRGLQQLRTKLDSSYGSRREWVCALLPLALDGPDGWWPSSVNGVAGVSYGAVTVAFAALLAVALGVWRALPGAGQPREDRRVASVSTEAPSAGAGADFAEDELVESPPSLARTALTAPLSTSSSSAKAGTLRLRINSRLGPVPGARVVAHSTADGQSRVYQVSSELVSEDGIHLKLTFGGLFVDRNGPPDAQRVIAVADRAGIVELEVLDGAPWTVQIEADGFAPRSLSICVTAPALEQEVELEIGSKLIVDRGALPLESSVLVKLYSAFESREREALLPRGEQQVEVQGLAPGVFAIEALSTGGVELAFWSIESAVERDQVTRLDLSLGGISNLEVDVLGATPATAPQFAVACGPLNSRGSPSWARYALVRSGTARFVALPPGPALIKLLSRHSEIGRAWVELRQSAETQRLAIGIPSGELRVLHDASDTASRRFELACRSQRFGSRAGWIAMGGPLSRPGEAHYVGLDEGDYCLWVIEDGSAQRFEFQIVDGLVELDLRFGAENVASVRVERGPGVDPEGSIELEYLPQQWLQVVPVEGALALSHGVHRIRTASPGIGHIARSIEVPREERVLLDEPIAAAPIEVLCDSVWSGTTVIVTPESAPAPPQRSRSLSLYFDREGRGMIDLHPGAYVLTDRSGRRASMTVAAGVRSVLVRAP